MSAARLPQRLPQPKRAEIISLGLPKPFTLRQNQVISLAAQGIPWVDIPSRVGISIKTLEFWRRSENFKNAYSKARDVFLSQACSTARKDFESLEPLAIIALKCALDANGTNRQLKASLAVLQGRGYFQKEESPKTIQTTTIKFGVIETLGDLDDDSNDPDDAKGSNNPSQPPAVGNNK